jgi:hypothetical protein
MVSTPQFGGVQQQQRGQRQEIRKTFDIHNKWIDFVDRKNVHGPSSSIPVEQIHST